MDLASFTETFIPSSLVPGTLILVTNNDPGSRLHKGNPFTFNVDTVCGTSASRLATTEDATTKKMCFFCNTIPDAAGLFTPKKKTAQEEPRKVTVEIAGNMVARIALHLTWFIDRAELAEKAKVGSGVVRRMEFSPVEAESLRALLAAHKAGKGTGKSLGPVHRIQRTLTRVEAAIFAASRA